MKRRAEKKGHISRKDLERTLKIRLDELTALYDVSKTITSSLDLKKMLKIIVEKVSRIMHANICAIHLLKNDRLSLKAHCGIKKNLLPLKSDFPLKGNFLGQVVTKRHPYIVRDLYKYRKTIFYKLVKQNELRSLLAVPLIERDNVIGTLTIISRKTGAFTRNDEEELSLFASQAAVAIENARLFQETKANYLNTMRLLASVIDAKDSYTEDHSEKVMRYALGIASKLNLSDSKRRIIRFASILHDIGKINVDIGILRKPGPLTRQEWERVIEHPRVGAEILEKAGFLSDLIPPILYHHVRYAGGGYPTTKMKGASIPVEARILAVADAYEAMTSNRPYRTRMTKSQAIAELKRCAGSQFDPKVVRAFVRFVKKKKK